jgi:hypothetical protein
MNMMPGMKQMVVVNVLEDKPEMPNVEIHAIGTDVIININSHKLFNTLSDMDLILVGLDKKLKELLQKHLESNARKEVDILRMRKREAEEAAKDNIVTRDSAEAGWTKDKPKGKTFSSHKQDYFG